MFTGVDRVREFPASALKPIQDVASQVGCGILCALIDLHSRTGGGVIGLRPILAQGSSVIFDTSVVCGARPTIGN